MKAGNPLAGCLLFIIFTFSLAEIRLCRTVVRRRNGYSTTLRIFIYSGMLKSADRKFCSKLKFSPTTESFRAPFSKGAEVKGAPPLSRSAEREISYRRFLFCSFFFCACMCKRKSGWRICFFFCLLTILGFCMVGELTHMRSMCVGVAETGGINTYAKHVCWRRRDRGN